MITKRKQVTSYCKKRIEKDNPRRKLTSVEKIWLMRPEAIAYKLKSVEKVQNCQLKTLLRDDEYAQIEVEWK